MKRLAPVLLALGLGVGCASAADPVVDTRPGVGAVYDRIEALTDCSELQAEFDLSMGHYDRAPTDSSLEYAKTALARMEQIGCP